MNAKIASALSIVEQFRELDDDVPARTMSAFLAIAAEPGKGMGEYARRLRLSQSAMSRNVARLASFSSQGMGLVEIYEDPNDRRAKLVVLTPRGEELVRKLQR